MCVSVCVCCLKASMLLFSFVIYNSESVSFLILLQQNQYKQVAISIYGKRWCPMTLKKTLEAQILWLYCGISSSRISSEFGLFFQGLDVLDILYPTTNITPHHHFDTICGNYI